MSDDQKYGPTVDDEINAGGRVAFALLVAILCCIYGAVKVAEWAFSS